MRLKIKLATPLPPTDTSATLPVRSGPHVQGLPPLRADQSHLNVNPVVPKYPIDLRDQRHQKVVTTRVPENQKIIDALQRLIEFTDLQIAQTREQSHRFRKRQFQQALVAIKTYSEQIVSGAQAQRDIPNVGRGIASRIDEILHTGNLSEIDDAQNDTTRAILDLCRVPGIGVKTALSFMERFGVNSLSDLRACLASGELTQGKHQLTHQMILGIRYFEDLQHRIPRDEITAIKNILEREVHALDHEFRTEVCGSYRRGLPTSGDIDFLVTHPAIRTEAQVTEQIMNSIVGRLKGSGLIVDQISSSKIKFMGYCRLDAEHRGRHLDILFVPYDSWIQALIYFTGSQRFNILLRTEALKQGYTLNEFGMYRYWHGIKEDQSMIFQTEQELFAFLQIVYLEPSEREF